MESLKTENSAVNSVFAGAAEMIKKTYENRMMILIFALVGVALCFYGAMQMRNLKKQGYLIYVVGEILPIISFAVFIGFGSLFGGITMIFSTLIAVVFIILYTLQRKHLVN
jgi:ribose/xylose/arabinose/galactoside ABC-type transport system permease subunit